MNKKSYKIFCGDLVKELDMPNARNLNYMFDSIGNALLELGEEWQYTSIDEVDLKSIEIAYTEILFETQFNEP